MEIFDTINTAQGNVDKDKDLTDILGFDPITSNIMVGIANIRLHTLHRKKAKNTIKRTTEYF